MTIEEIDNVVKWSDSNCWYDDRAEEMAISPRELKEFLETLLAKPLK